jgi:hypothetical protein
MSIKKFAFIAAIAFGTMLPLSTYMTPPVLAESESEKKFMDVMKYMGSAMVMAEAAQLLFKAMKATCIVSDSCTAVEKGLKASEDVSEDDSISDAAESIIEAVGDDAAGDLVLGELASGLASSAAAD